MPFQVFRTSKLKFHHLSGCGDHLHRHGRSAKLNYVHHDRHHLNRTLIGEPGQDIKQAITNILEAEGYRRDIKISRHNQAKQKLRKINQNATWAIEILLTASPEFFNEDTTNKWIDKNREFLLETFGKNCIHAELHQDEKTPHIHAVIVPLVERTDGRKHLCATDPKLLGGPKYRMCAWQDLYHKWMAPLGLERGERGSDDRHRTTAEGHRHESKLLLQQREENAQQLSEIEQQRAALRRQLDELEEKEAESKAAIDEAAKQTAEKQAQLTALTQQQTEASAQLAAIQQQIAEQQRQLWASEIVGWARSLPIQPGKTIGNRYRFALSKNLTLTVSHRESESVLLTKSANEANATPTENLTKQHRDAIQQSYQQFIEQTQHQQAQNQK
jgi:hypothetical protein